MATQLDKLKTFANTVGYNEEKFGPVEDILKDKKANRAKNKKANKSVAYVGNVDLLKDNDYYDIPYQLVELATDSLINYWPENSSKLLYTDENDNQYNIKEAFKNAGIEDYISKVSDEDNNIFNGIYDDDMDEETFMRTLKKDIGDEVWKNFNTILDQTEVIDIDKYLEDKKNRANASEEETEEDKEPEVEPESVDMDKYHIPNGMYQSSHPDWFEKWKEENPDMPEEDVKYIQDKYINKEIDHDDQPDKEAKAPDEEVDVDKEVEKMEGSPEATEQEDTTQAQDKSNDLTVEEPIDKEDKDKTIEEPDVIDEPDEPVIEETKVDEKEVESKEKEPAKKDEASDETKAEKDFEKMKADTPDPDPTDEDNISYGKDETEMNTGRHIPDNDDSDKNLPAINAPAIKKEDKPSTEVKQPKPDKKDDDITDAEFTIKDAETWEPEQKAIEPPEAEVQPEPEEKPEEEKNDGIGSDLLKEAFKPGNKADEYDSNVQALKINPGENVGGTVEVSDGNAKCLKKNNTNDNEEQDYFKTPDKLIASDRRLKELFGDDDRVACIAKVNSYDFKYKPEVQKSMGVDGDEHTGVVAQEIEANPAFKGCVTELDNGYKALKVPELTAANTSAIGDIARKVEELESLLLDLKNTIGDRK